MDVLGITDPQGAAICRMHFTPVFFKQTEIKNQLILYDEITTQQNDRGINF